jgi:hypothetical protein
MPLSFEYLTHSLALRFKLVGIHHCIPICNMALEHPRIGLLIHSIQDEAIQFLRDWGCDTALASLSSVQLKIGMVSSTR